MSNPTIETGAYWVTVTCPQCAQDELVPVALIPRLQRTPDEATLGVKFGQKAAAHRCGQTSISVVGETGEIVGQIELGGRPVTPEPPRCARCVEGAHDECVGWIPTGRQVPDTDRYRDATRMVPEFVACGCGCRVGVES